MRQSMCNGQEDNMSKMEMKSQWIGPSQRAREELIDWLNERVRFNDVPRMTDIMSYVRDTGLALKSKDVRDILLKHGLFKMNQRQQRVAGRSRLYRPVIVNNLGHWHADIGYFAKNKRYSTPVSYRAGFLVAKDVLSRYVYATPLMKNKSAESLIRAFQVLFEKHRQQFPGVTIKSIAFDKETSVMSNKVQSFFAKENISFHAFEMSASKAKFAEGGIRLIREKMATLMRRNDPKDRWWNLLDHVVENLNSQPIVVDGKKIGMYRPRDVNSNTVKDFVNILHKKVPAYYFGQFDIAPGLVNFKYDVGTLVRAKLIATSSEVIGNKRSEKNLTDEIFVIEEQVPYVTKNMRVGVAYKCRDYGTTEKVEVFQEDKIVPTSLDGDAETETMSRAYMNDEVEENAKDKLRQLRKRRHHEEEEEV